MKNLFSMSEIDLILLALKNEYRKREKELELMEEDAAKAYAGEQLHKLALIIEKIRCSY